MSDPVRIFLRLLGGVLFVAGTIAIVAIVVIGPTDVGKLMGESCKTATDKVGEASHCYWRDALGILRELPWIVLVGAVLLVGIRPERDRPAGRGPLRSIGAALLVLTVIVTMVGAPVYAHAWTAVHQYKVAKEILQTPRPEIARP
ncbi:MAG TPA: hypothetical protein VF533_13980 [Solirubrobacteraceae bacterium]|jgi:hypothetical protein